MVCGLQTKSSSDCVTFFWGEGLKLLLDLRSVSDHKNVKHSWSGANAKGFGIVLGAGNDGERAGVCSL